MTDREIAIRIGNYINGLIQRIVVYEGVFIEYRLPTELGAREIPFREDAKRIAQEPSLIELADARRDGLLAAIGSETESSALIRILQNQFLDGEGRLR